MLDTAKNVMHSVGGGTAHLARFVGEGTADLARKVGHGTADVARKVGHGTADVARRVGPKRGIIGLVVLGAAIGGTFYLVRYLRSRQDDLDAGTMTDDELAAPPTGKGGKRKRRHARGTVAPSPRT